jgi:hypothetical protein
MVELTWTGEQPQGTDKGENTQARLIQSDQCLAVELSQLRGSRVEPVDKREITMGFGHAACLSISLISSRRVYMSRKIYSTAAAKRCRLKVLTRVRSAESLTVDVANS